MATHPAQASQPDSLSEAQIAYLSDVLGVHSLILPELSPEGLASDVESAQLAEAPASQVTSPRAESNADSDVGRTVRVRGDLASSRLICLFHEPFDWPLGGDRAEMASKMIMAMKLDPVDVLEIEWRGDQVQSGLRSMILSAGSRPVLLFGIQSATALLGAPAKIGAFIDFDGVHVMPTYSLVELAAQPNLKKATWSHMQQVMKTLI